MAFTKHERAWAIEMICEYRALVGYGYFGWNRPQHFGGYTTATFRTQREARAAAKKLNAGMATMNVRFRVVRIAISIIQK